jgi:hypothetical protein
MNNLIIFVCFLIGIFLFILLKRICLCRIEGHDPNATVGDGDIFWFKCADGNINAFRVECDLSSRNGRIVFGQLVFPRGGLHGTQFVPSIVPEGVTPLESWRQPSWLKSNPRWTCSDGGMTLGEILRQIVEVWGRNNNVQDVMPDANWPIFDGFLRRFREPSPAEAAGLKMLGGPPPEDILSKLAELTILSRRGRDNWQFRILRRHLPHGQGHGRGQVAAGGAEQTAGDTGDAEQTAGGTGDAEQTAGGTGDAEQTAGGTGGAEQTAGGTGDDSTPVTHCPPAAPAFEFAAQYVATGNLDPNAEHVENTEYSCTDDRVSAKDRRV